MASPSTFTGPPTDLKFTPEKLTETQRKFWDDSNAFLERLKRSQPSLPPNTYNGLQYICWSLQHRFNDTRDLRAHPVHDVLAELDGLRGDLTNPLVTRYAAYLRLNRLMDTRNVRRDYFNEFFGRFSLVLPEQGGRDLLLFSPSKAKDKGANIVAVNANGDVTPAVIFGKAIELEAGSTETQRKTTDHFTDFHRRLLQNKEDLPPDVYKFLFETEASLKKSFADNPNLKENPVHNVLDQLDLLLDDMLNPMISTYDALRRINQLATTKRIHKESLSTYFGQFRLVAGPDVDLLTLQMQSVKLIAPAAEANPNRVNLTHKFDKVENAAPAASVSPAQDPDTDAAPDSEASEGEARWCVVS